MKMKNPLNNRQQLKTLLNDAGFSLLLISSLYLCIELIRWGLSKNGIVRFWGMEVNSNGISDIYSFKLEEY